jgi:hypothetical protein
MGDTAAMRTEAGTGTAGKRGGTMPQLVALAAIGAGLWALARLLRREMTRVEASLREVDAALRRKPEQPRVTLERDPGTGVYRPRPD